MKCGKYTLVVAPDDYPGTKYRDRYCYEHHVVAWRYIGYDPTSDLIVHHKDGNCRNNSVGNLKVMTNSEHTAMHGFMHGKKVAVCVCPYCKKEFERYEHRVHAKKGYGNYKYCFCSRSCSAKFYWRKTELPDGFVNILRVEKRYMGS